MRKSLLCIFIVCSLLLTSCFSYKDINRQAFVTTVIVDINGEGKPSLYIEVFRPFRNEEAASGKAQRLVFYGVGEDMYEALRVIDLTSSQQLNFTQNKAIIFTRRAAEKGIDNFIDFLNRNQQFLLRQFLFITDSEPSKLLEVKLAEEQFLGIYLADISLTREDYAKVHTMRIDEYLNQRLVGSEVVLLPVIAIKSTSFDNKLNLSGAAVMQNDKYKDFLEIGESREYKIMMNTARKGLLDIEYQDTGNYMAFDILRSKTNTDITYNGETIYLIKNIYMKLSFAETQRPLTLDSEANLAKIRKNVEDKLKDEMNKLFNKWKEKGIDIFKVKETFEKVYPDTKLDVKDMLEITELKLKMKIEIEGSTDVTNFVE